jgi:hypothetical protein
MLLSDFRRDIAARFVILGRIWERPSWSLPPEEHTRTVRWVIGKRFTDEEEDLFSLCYNSSSENVTHQSDLDALLLNKKYTTDVIALCCE